MAIIRIIVVAQLLLQMTLLLFASHVHSCVYNESGRIASGLVHLSSGDFSLFRVDPPLTRLVCAVPLVFVDNSELLQSCKFAAAFPHQRQEYEAGRCLLRAYGETWLRRMWIARFNCVIVALVGAGLCYHCAAHWKGGFAGITAMAMYLTCPHFLGHGCVVGGDVAAGVGGLAAVCFFWRWLRQPDWLHAFVAGTTLGLAELCKFTLLVLYPLLPALWVVCRLPEWRSGSVMARVCLRQGVMLLSLLLLSICVINCGYLFEGTLTPLEEFRFQTTIFTGASSLDDVPPQGGNRFAGTWLGKVPVPLPANMVQGIDTQRYDFERGLPSYMLGQWADHGWWHYYVYALAVKVPLGTWCLVGLAVGVTVFGRGYNSSWRDEMIVLAPGLAILVFVSSQTGFSVHSRYVIPALPFFFVWISKVARVFEMRPLGRSQHLVAATVVLSLTWSIGSSLWAYPHSLSYFNELAGGPRNGGEHLLDSNIDWGQDLLYLKDWLDAHPEVTLDGLAYWGSCPATLSGIPETPRPPAASAQEWEHAGRHSKSGGPKPGWYAVSVNHLYGRSGEFRYFLRFEPVASAGYSIYIYHITLDDANRVRRELGLPEL